MTVEAETEVQEQLNEYQSALEGIDEVCVHTCLQTHAHSQFLFACVPRNTHSLKHPLPFPSSPQALQSDPSSEELHEVRSENTHKGVHINRDTHRVRGTT